MRAAKAIAFGKNTVHGSKEAHGTVLQLRAACSQRCLCHRG